jgi:hypothetical protein
MAVNHLYLDGSQAQMVQAMRDLVTMLHAACKVDGRVVIDGMLYEVSLVDVQIEPSVECSFRTEPETQRHRTLGNALDHVRLLYHTWTITVDGTVTKWCAKPLGKSVPGQHAIEHA